MDNIGSGRTSSSRVTLVRDLERPRQINVQVCRDFDVPTLAQVPVCDLIFQIKFYTEVLKQ